MSSQIAIDALFALPVLTRAISSFGTLINILFFYLNWAALVLSCGPLNVELGATTAVRVIFYLIPSLLFFVFDALVPSLAVLLKAQGETGLPSGTKQGWMRLEEVKVAGWAVLNVVMGICAQAAIEYIRIGLLGWDGAVKVTLGLPMPWEVIGALVKGFLGREVSYCCSSIGIQLNT